MKKILLALAVTGLLAGCHSNGDNKADKQQAAQTSAAIDSILQGDWRDANNAKRDQYRHPKQTLNFFGVKPTDTVIEISPGAGWYTEILAPLVKEQGRYFGTVTDPSKTSSDRARDYNAEQNKKLRDKMAARADVYGNASLIEIDPKAPVFGEAGAADAVLTFRNVHNWMGAGTEAQMFEAFFEALKPGGTLGVVEHRANQDVPKGDRSGYVSEAQVIAMAIKAGFVLDARSEINANPKDTKDYPNGVWTLPPNLRDGEKDREKYLAIGESDRMTLRFKKPQ
jgi:predicted methyltransferase